MEPCLIKVALNTVQEEGEWLFTHIGIDEEKQEGCVEELHIESHFSCFFKLLSLCWISNPCNSFDNDGTEYKVEDCDEVFERCYPDEHLEDPLFINMANFYVVRMTIGRMHGVVMVFLHLSLTEALECSARW